MMVQKYRVLLVSGLIFFLGLVFLPVVQAQADQDQSATPEKKIIKEIKLVGLTHTNPQHIRNKIQSKENSPLDSAILDGDIQRLHGTGLFADIDIQQVSRPDGGLNLIFVFRENEYVEGVIVDGMKELRPNTVRENFKIVADQPFDPFFIKQDIDWIRSEYLKKGFPFVEVKHRVEDGFRGKLVYYLIHEGPKVKVKKIIFTGNKNFARRRALLLFSKNPLLKIIKTQPSYWYSSSYYNEQQLQIDLERLKTFYREKGFLDVNAFIADVIFNEDRSKAEIAIHIDEGARYHIGDLKIAGNTVLTSDEITEKIKLQAGSPYILKTIMTDLRAIKSLYGRQGYIDCDIDIRTHFPLEPGRVNVTYQIEEGHIKHLNQIKIVGNEKTKDKVIRHRVELYPGELVDYDKIKLSLDHIWSTRYFEMVDFDLEDAAQPHYKNITFKVREGMTGMLRIGGGYSSTSGWGGMLEMQESNFDITRWPTGIGNFFTQAFRGGGQQFRIYWQPGSLEKSSGVNFLEPYFLNKPIKLGFNYFKSDRDWTNYDEKRQGASVTLARRFKKNVWEIGLTPRAETIEVSNVNEDAGNTVIDELKGTNRIRSINSWLTWDKRNSWMVPSKGFKTSLSYEYTGGRLGGDFNFLKTYYKFKQFNNLSSLENKKIVLSFESRLGVVKEFGDSDAVPIFERFYAGGISTVRGFEYRTISPKENGLSVGGRVLAVLRAELTFPLYTEEVQARPLDIMRGVLFYDAGNVANKWKDLKWETARSSAGLGLRFQLGPLPIEVAFSYPIKEEDDDETERLQLNFGFNY
ncbi:MAG: outer membrane protein assembly factor BamA [Planctomycetes bacterium]|nr:outer membrane protein assembly factor BamA [Planctomycetota bacterium]